jgi:hypothetical protein
VEWDIDRMATRSTAATFLPEAQNAKPGVSRAAVAQTAAGALPQ